MNRKAIGEAYRSRRESLGLSQARVAQLAHVTDGVLSRLERGIGTRPPHNLRQLGNAIGWDEDWWWRLSNDLEPVLLLTQDVRRTAPPGTAPAGMAIEVRIRGVQDPALREEAEREAYRAAGDVLFGERAVNFSETGR